MPGGRRMQRLIMSAQNLRRCRALPNSTWRSASSSKEFQEAARSEIEKGIGLAHKLQSSSPE